MAFKDLLTLTQFYTQFDPYFYTTDNRPLNDLDTRDNQISDELDRRVSFLSINGAAGTIVSGPTGWTIAKVGTGVFTITHGLNTLNYGVNGTAIHATTSHTVFVSDISLNSFTVKTVVTTTGAAADVTFSCIKTGF